MCCASSASVTSVCDDEWQATQGLQEGGGGCAAHPK